MPISAEMSSRQQQQSTQAAAAAANQQRSSYAAKSGYGQQVSALFLLESLFCIYSIRTLYQIGCELYFKRMYKYRSCSFANLLLDRETIL